MKIAVVHQPIGSMSASEPNGSIEIWTYELTRRWAQSAEVIVYAKQFPNQKKFEMSHEVHYKRISTVVDEWFNILSKGFDKLGRFSLFKKMKSALFFRNVKRPIYASSVFYFTYILQVIKDINKEKCDIVYLHNFSQFVPIIRAFNPKIKIILHMACEWLTQLDEKMIETRLQKADLIVGCSNYITKKVQEFFPQFVDRCQTSYNGVDIDHFNSNSEVDELTDEDTVKRLLFVGRVSPEKGLHFLLEAFQQIVKRYPRAQLQVVGAASISPLEFVVALTDDIEVSRLARFYNENGYIDHLQKQLVSFNIKENVTFTGFIPHKHLVKYYQQADVLINPSFSEAFGMSLVEAMACQTPVVATAVGGMPEIVEEQKNGSLVEAGNAPELTKALLRILSDDALMKKMKNAARQRAVELFSWDKIADDLMCQFKTMCV